MKIKKLGCRASVVSIMAVIGYLIYGTISGMYSQYGNMGINYAVMIS